MPKTSATSHRPPDEDADMTRLATTPEGTALVGNDDGFVPLNSSSDFDTATEALAAMTDGSLSPDSALANPIPDDHLQFTVPFSPVGKLWGIGLNYAEHATDLDEDRPEEPASFMKPSTALTGPGGPIQLPPQSQSNCVTAEAELGVVIGRTCRNVTAGNADEVIAGFVPVIDMTAEDILQRNPRFLTRSKSFDTFLVLGPWIRSSKFGSELADIEVRTVVNDTVEARNTINNMLFSPHELVAFHSNVMTLRPGDVISTGTPGAHPIEDGDSVRAEVDEVGQLTADVVR